MTILLKTTTHIYLQYQILELVIGEESRLVVSLCVGVERTPQHLHVLDCHAEHCELVKLSRGAHWDNAAQFHDVRIHLVTAALFNLTMVLSVGRPINKILLIITRAWHCYDFLFIFF